MPTMKKKKLILRMDDEVINEDALFFLALNTVYTGKGHENGTGR